MSFAIRTVRAIGDVTVGTLIVLVHVVLVDRDAKRITRIPKPNVLE